MVLLGVYFSVYAFEGRGYSEEVMSDEFQKNVLGERLEDCSHQPLTGWYRDGCCNTDAADVGLHTVCVKVNMKFLEFLKETGNDLITPTPDFGFPGLKDNDSWCVCSFLCPSN